MKTLKLILTPKLEHCSTTKNFADSCDIDTSFSECFLGDMDLTKLEIDRSNPILKQSHYLNLEPN